MVFMKFGAESKIELGVVSSELDDDDDEEEEEELNRHGLAAALGQKKPT